MKAVRGHELKGDRRRSLKDGQGLGKEVRKQRQRREEERKEMMK